jgi:lactoylglutathione lyase
MNKDNLKKTNSKTQSEVDQLIAVMKSATSVELHVKSFKGLREYYKNLGFEILFDSPGNYLVLAKGKAIVNFWGDGGMYPEQPYFKKWRKTKGKSGYDVEIIIPVPNIKKYYTEIKEKVKVVEELKHMPWGADDFRIEDPNGFYIRFTEPHDWVFEFGGYLSDKD